MLRNLCASFGNANGYRLVEARSQQHMLPRIRVFVLCYVVLCCLLLLLVSVAVGVCCCWFLLQFLLSLLVVVAVVCSCISKAAALRRGAERIVY